jgi:DNA end-binding protein Ku
MASTVWKGFVSFGLVSFPVSLQVAARDNTLRFHMLHKTDLSPIKEVFYCRKENKQLQRDDLVKGFEVSKDRYVVVDPKELEKISPKTAQVMDILQFVKDADLDPIFFDKSYHMLPDGAISKPYALLRDVMKKRQRFGIAKVTMHNREYIVALRPRDNEIMLHTMYYVSEIQEVAVKAGSAKFSAKELELAGQLIDTLSSKFEPEKFHDTYQENVARLIEQKQKGETVRGIRAPRPAPVVDILQALRKSLSQKPTPAGTPAPAKTRKRKVA